ncbi:MAG: hypothetical protein DI598_16395 [Pseudopedobacter saltans]|uniref:Uncharacterized protein n=1 Tax=Pseudopedobacter saltans TaxID=151895 RepID=A0A2W5EMX7_9SPHI|nr:MAG: hypothetical protein DI598_16395 [Pseudopedobacter saltans]
MATNKNRLKLTITKFSILDLLLTFVLYFLYRILVSNSHTNSEGFFSAILEILVILTELGFSFVFFVLMSFNSLVIFFNFIPKIRNTWFLSMMTFLLVPLIVCVFFLVSGLIRFGEYSMSPLMYLMLFLIARIIFSILEFFIFRRKIERVANSLSFENQN